MDDKKYEFLPDDFEFIGDKQNINIDEVAPARPAWKDVVYRFTQNKGAIFGLACIIIIALLAIFVPMISHWKYDAIDTSIANVLPNGTHIFGTDKYGRDTVILALIFTEWIPMSRITRAQVLKIKEDEFILASRTLGASNIFILFKEILPNIFGQLIIMSMMTIPNAIFYEAYLAFVGLGLTVPQASLGTLINSGFEVFTVYPTQMTIPAIILAVLMLGFNLLGDGLRDALDPTMKEM